MALTLVDQLTDIAGSGEYDDAISGAETQVVAEAQTSLEGDLNVVRTLVARLKNTSAFYTDPDMTLNGIAQRYEQIEYQPSGFINVATGTGTSSGAFDTAIKSITDHNDGAGSSLAEGVILNATFDHKLVIRDHDTQNAVDDGSGNEVYGRLSHSSTPIESGDDNNQLSGYALITGVTDANTDASKALHLSVVDDTGGFFHVDIYSDVARTQLVGHTATYNSTGSKAIVEDNASGLGGTITVDAVTAADTDIKVIFGAYTLTWYSWVSGVETPYDFTLSQDIDLVEVLVSRQFKDRPWTRVYHPSFHDVAGFTGSVADDNVNVDGMTGLYNGLTTQATVNAKGDDLGIGDTNGQGLHLVLIDDTATGSNGYFTGTTGQAALGELKTQLGGTTSTTYAFTEDNVVTDNDAVYAALNKLDLKWGDLASVATGEGASLVGIEDVGAYTAETDVEGALQELYTLVGNADFERRWVTAPSDINIGGTLTIPGGLSYTPSTYGENMQIWVNGLLWTADDEDYDEAVSGPATTVTVNRKIKAGARVEVIVWK